MQQQDNHEYPFLYQRQTCHQVQPNQATYQKRQKCQPATYLQEVKHWGLRKSRNATSLNSRFKSLDTLKVKIISVTFRRVIRTNHKKASKIWRHENIQLGGCQS